jgi:hypothetical protein
LSELWPHSDKLREEAGKLYKVRWDLTSCPSKPRSEYENFVTVSTRRKQFFVTNE